MFKNVCKIVVEILYVTLIYSSVSAQKNSSWNIQPIAIQTRFAKDVNPDKVLQEYPRPQMVRKGHWKMLNGLWDYAITDSSAGLPSSFNGKILVPFPIESALSGVQKVLLPSQILWYKRKFLRPILKIDERCILNFGAVDWQTTVSINGKSVGSHSGGYTSFSFDITDFLTNGQNELIVRVYDPTDQGINPHGKQSLNPANIYYTASSGIWQPVWLETVGKVNISGINISPNIDKKLVVFNLSAEHLDTSVQAEVLVTAAGKKVYEVTGLADATFALKIPNMRLWSPEDPFLYDLSVKLVKNKKVIDEITSYFGMRKVGISKDSAGIDRIFLNNMPYFNLGTLDQGFWPDGLYTAPSDSALQFDIQTIKAMGFNTIRKHIKIESARWYYHADKLGMIVWQDFVSPNPSLANGSKQEFENELAETMDQLNNYTCITTWVLFNEKWGQYDQARLTKWIKDYDPSRIVNGHSGEYLYVNNMLRSPSPNAYVNSDITDVHSYPKPMMSLKLPGMAQVCGEFGGIGLPVEGHLWDDLVAGWGYDGVTTTSKMKEQFTQLVDSLVILKEQGLSASIYTQPFDVESEQNGLITYDRMISKLPIDTIRIINLKLSSKSTNHIKVSKGLSFQVADTLVADYVTRLQQYKGGKKDSAFLRSLTLLAQNKKDKVHIAQLANEYIFKLKDPFQTTNLKFIQRFTRHTDDAGFAVLYNNIQKVDCILGKDEAEIFITVAIENDEIKPRIPKTGRPDWDVIQEICFSKYGDIGREISMQSQILYAVNNKDWNLFKKVGKIWFTRYGFKRKWISALLLNNIAWAAFEQSNDKEVLEAALLMSKKSIEQADDRFIDTYANVLYKLGEKEEAIKWEEKAVQNKKGAVDEHIYVEILDRMKKGTPTWK